jgi:UDP-N-acetylmuramoyl-L-alanyl-D-glutamate--2,6-diaminopimelate ligase
METYHAGGKTVIVDYAHNGMALAALLRSARTDYPGQPVAVVFGCTGGKGLDRREGMGKAAGEYADAIYLTEDDPGPEEVEAICREVGGYITPYGKTYAVIPDREEAVRRAITEAPSPAVILLAGKGSEQRQMRKNGPEPCVPDGMLARKYLGLPLLGGEPG